MVTNTTNYKSCPLKKRPIVYETCEDDAAVEVTTPVKELKQHPKHESTAHVVISKVEAARNYSSSCTESDGENEWVYCRSATRAQTRNFAYCEFWEQDTPQDLSLKKAKRKTDDYPAECEPVPKHAKICTEETMPLRPLAVNYSDLSNGAYSSAMLSPHEDSEEPMPADIHLRGLTAATNSYTTTSTFKSAFELAVGHSHLTALWSRYHQPHIQDIFPSPASSLDGSPRIVYTSSRLTPPLSPSSHAPTEPEDLSMRSDIPLPALFHHFDETRARALFNNTVSSSASSPSASSSSSVKVCRYKCKKCSKMYSTAIGLSKHEQFHCPAAECNQEKKEYSCQKCGKLYTTTGALKMHIRTHTLPCKCPICAKAFSRPWLLQGHIRTHTGEKPFQCDECPRSFADRSNLRAHQQTHVSVKKYACKVCRKSFSRMSLLNKHVNTNCTITIV